MLIFHGRVKTLGSSTFALYQMISALGRVYRSDRAPAHFTARPLLRGTRKQISLCFGHVRSGPTFNKFSQPVQGVGKFAGHRREPKAKMRGRIETIPGGEQDALFRGRLAKGAAVLSTH